MFVSFDVYFSVLAYINIFEISMDIFELPNKTDMFKLDKSYNYHCKRDKLIRLYIKNYMQKNTMCKTVNKYFKRYIKNNIVEIEYGVSLKYENSRESTTYIDNIYLIDKINKNPEKIHDSKSQLCLNTIVDLINNYEYYIIDNIIIIPLLESKNYFIKEIKLNNINIKNMTQNNVRKWLLGLFDPLRHF